MYGLVNKSIEELVVEQFGNDAWETIRTRAGVDFDVFISNEGYPDDITYALVGAASEVLGLPVESILQVFGEHWVLKTASNNYGAMLRAGGATLKEFLVNLPNFHTRVAMLYPNLVPPSFVCADVTESGLTLHYHTHRLGLTHFVIGILTGLGKLYECPCVTQVVASRSDGASHDVFAVRW